MLDLNWEGGRENQFIFFFERAVRKKRSGGSVFRKKAGRQARESSEFPKAYPLGDLVRNFGWRRGGRGRRYRCGKLEIYFFSKKKLGLGNELWRSNTHLFRERTHPRGGFSSSWIWGLRTGCAGLTFMPRLGGICFDELGVSLF